MAKFALDCPAKQLRSRAPARRYCAGESDYGSPRRRHSIQRDRSSGRRTACNRRRIHCQATDSAGERVDGERRCIAGNRARGIAYDHVERGSIISGGCRGRDVAGRVGARDICSVFPPLIAQWCRSSRHHGEGCSLSCGDGLIRRLSSNRGWNRCGTDRQCGRALVTEPTELLTITSKRGSIISGGCRWRDVAGRVGARDICSAFPPLIAQWRGSSRHHGEGCSLSCGDGLIRRLSGNRGANRCGTTVNVARLLVTQPTNWRTVLIKCADPLSRCGGCRRRDVAGCVGARDLPRFSAIDSSVARFQPLPRRRLHSVLW